MKLHFIGPLHEIVSAPLVAEAAGAAHHQPVEDGQEKGPLHIEGEEPLRKKPLEDLWNSQLFPQPLENESGAYPCGFCTNVASAGKDKEGLFRKPRQGANQGFHFPLGVHLIEPAKRCDNLLVSTWGPSRRFSTIWRYSYLPDFLVRANMLKPPH